MAASLPVTTLEMNRIGGVGEAKLENYGRAFMELIEKSPEYQKAKADGTLTDATQPQLNFASPPVTKGHATTSQPTPTEPEDPAKVARKAARQRDKERIGSTPSHIYSLNAFQAGEPVADIAARREMTKQTVVGHLARCYAAGEDVNLASLIPAQAGDWVAEANAALPDAEGAKVIVDWVNEKYGANSIDYGTLKVLEALAKRSAMA